jgi:hypothetical protein
MYGGEGTGTSTDWLVKNAALTAPTEATSASLQIISLGSIDTSSPGYLWIDNAGIATVQAPVFDPAGLTTSQTTSVPVTITSATAGATIYYTLDGSTPTTASLYGTSPVTVTVNSNATLKAIAKTTGYLDSVVTSKTYHCADYQISAMSSMTKLRQDQMPSAGGTTFSLHAARGEGESGQILIATTEAIEQVTIEASSLTGPNGATIMPEIFRVAYVPVTSVVWPTLGFGVAGNYPDPLLLADSFDVAANTSQSVFFNVWVPADVPGGEYTGTITLSAENACTKTVTLILHVYDIDLPKQPFLKTDMQIWNFLPGWYGANYSGPMLDRTRLLCLKYRCTSPEWMDLRYFITKNADGTFTANWTGFDQSVQYFFGQGATVFRLQDLFTQEYTLPATQQEEADMGIRLAMTQTHLEEKGWLDRCYFYIFDEPDSSKIISIQVTCNLIHEYAPKLRVLLTYNPGFGTDTPTQFIDYIDLWVPIMNYYNESFLSARQAAGDEVWGYTCGSQLSPYLNGIDHTLTAPRAVGWWCWRYKVTGYLYWCMDYWTKNPWVDPQTYLGVNGDGYLLWPDQKKTHDPYPSIRLACTRDGFEDFDLMYMLQTRINAIKSNSSLYLPNKTLVDNAETVLDISSVISSTTTFSTDPNVYEQRHQAILENLDSLKDIDSAIFGDANFDGVVDGIDLCILVVNFGMTSGATWGEGDFNGDGAIDIDDLTILADNFGAGSDSALGFSSDYANTFNTTTNLDDSSEVGKDTEELSNEDASLSMCSSLGFLLVTGLMLMGLMLVKLEE